ncbi:uncharacterized protein [Notothenia coriiceps]|uniref:Spondin-1 n=1 Tax=Notothenia coriiceps TaxID=8208 RepID=A0A6I9NJN2_9TELE|nr:PREDICTED: uncharacterized protein LOC104949966 [Notothenia coriiceps]
MEKDSKETKTNPAASAGLVSKIFFWWLNPLFRIGYKRKLEEGDMYDVLTEDRSKNLGQDLRSGTMVSAEVDEVVLEDGTKIKPVSVIFPEGSNIPAQKHDQRQLVGIQNQEANVTPLACTVSFCSSTPLSVCTTITFTDHLHNRFKVKLFAIANNCVLTVWPYMALHRSEQQIVLKTGTKHGTTAVELILQRYHTPSPASGPTSSPSSSSSSFDHNSSTNKKTTSDEHIKYSFPNSDSVSGQTSRNTDVSPNTTINLGTPEFPAADSEEGLYYQNVLLAVERWFSLFGWPSGPNPISVPHTLRRVVSKIQMNPTTGRTYRVSQNKDSRSVVGMLHHLTGKQIPGIPRCQMFSSDIDQCTHQLLQQHEAMLTFLRVQGASLCHIRPEYLLDVQEFKHWCSLQSNEEDHGLDYSSLDYESLSKRSWTDVLLQIYKVLVLCRVSERGSNSYLNPEDIDGILPVSSPPLASNIYSPYELQLLDWLNMHYKSMRKTVWGTGKTQTIYWDVEIQKATKELRPPSLTKCIIKCYWKPYGVLGIFTLIEAQLFRGVYQGEEWNTAWRFLFATEICFTPVTGYSTLTFSRRTAVGQFPDQVIWKVLACDTRVYVLKHRLASQGGSVHLDFRSPAHRSVTQDIPLHNETHQDWRMQAEVYGGGFSGPNVLNVPAGTRACYPLTFHPSARCTVTGKLSLHNDHDGTEHVFTLGGVGEHPLPVDHVLLQCSAGQTTHTVMNVPNYSQNKLTLKAETDLSAVSGPPSLEIEPGQSAPYTLAVLSLKRGKQTGNVSFTEMYKIQEADKHEGNVPGCYKVHFSLEIICKPAAPIKLIVVQCVAQSSVAIEIPVKNPRGEPLRLDVHLEGDDLSGANRVSIPPGETLTYKATFSPGTVGKSTGSVVFQSEQTGEFWYRLELYALPPPVFRLPEDCCQLGKWTRLSIPQVNPTAETMELTVTNSNPRNYTLEMDSGNTVNDTPETCIYSAWSPWSACSSSTCEKGRRMRQRMLKAQLDLSVPCPHTQDFQPCMGPGCSMEEPSTCMMSEWISWSACSVSCGMGMRSRERYVKQYPEDGSNCQLQTEDTEKCVVNDECSPSSCVVTEWAEWDPCSATCGLGMKRRERMVKMPPIDGSMCKTEVAEVEKCMMPECHSFPCMLSPWSDWTECSVTCGRGLRTRQRMLKSDPAECSEELEQSEKCMLPECPVDCMVSEWSEWSECNKSCGKGHTIRTRMIKLEPQLGGSACPETIQRKKCKIRKCHSKTKEERGGRGGGGRMRRRGKQGRDGAVEEQPGCRMQPWSSWTDCTKPCGGGIQERFMMVKKKAKGTQTGSCKDRKEIRACNVHPC